MLRKRKGEACAAKNFSRRARYSAYVIISRVSLGCRARFEAKSGISLTSTTGPQHRHKFTGKKRNICSIEPFIKLIFYSVNQLWLEKFSD